LFFVKIDLIFNVFGCVGGWIRVNNTEETLFNVVISINNDLVNLVFGIRLNPLSLTKILGVVSTQNMGKNILDLQCREPWGVLKA